MLGLTMNGCTKYPPPKQEEQNKQQQVPSNNWMVWPIPPHTEQQPDQHDYRKC